MCNINLNVPGWRDWRSVCQQQNNITIHIQTTSWDFHSTRENLITLTAKYVHFYQGCRSLYAVSESLQFRFPVSFFTSYKAAVKNEVSVTFSQPNFNFKTSSFAIKYIYFCQNIKYEKLWQKNTFKISANTLLYILFRCAASHKTSICVEGLEWWMTDVSKGNFFRKYNRRAPTLWCNTMDTKCFFDQVTIPREFYTWITVQCQE